MPFFLRISSDTLGENLARSSIVTTRIAMAATKNQLKNRNTENGSDDNGLAFTIKTDIPGLL